MVRFQKKKPDPFRLSFRPKRQKVRIKEEKIFGTIYKSEKESSGLFVNPKKNLAELFIHFLGASDFG